MKFDRYDILTRHYINEIEAWNWAAIKKDALSNCFVEDKQIIASEYLGSVLSLFPSGKFYMPWTTNQTRQDVIRDECFSAALEEVANRHDMFITGSEFDGCDVLVQMVVDNPEDVISYITLDEEEKAQDLFVEE